MSRYNDNEEKFKAINNIFSMNNLTVLDTPAELFYSMIDGMQHGLLTQDALYLAVMDQNHLTQW